MANLATRIFRFYSDGFRNMTVGRLLWLIIIIKLIIIFGVLKVFFFPDVLAKKASGCDKAAAARSELINRRPLKP